MKEIFKTKSPYEKKEKTDKKQEGLLSSEKKSLLNSKTPSFFDNKESTTQKIPSFMSNGDAEAVAQGKKLAREAIDGNLRRGVIDSAFLQSHPNLFDGLSMFYAHSLSKNKNPKAANEAYKYAYEETAPNQLLLNSTLGVNGYANKSLLTDLTSEKSGNPKLALNSNSESSEQSETDEKWFGKDYFDLSFLEEPYKAVKKVADSHTKIAKDIYGAIKKTVNDIKRKKEWSIPDERAPEDVIVESQASEEDRNAYFVTVYPDWLKENGNYVDTSALLLHYYQNPAQARYTGKYCLPIQKSAFQRISQGFYGDYSHAGRYDDSKNEYRFNQSNYLGAVDLVAPKGTPVYSILPGKVVYVAPKGTAMNRVTVKTELNGEIYYLEYLHMDKQSVTAGDEIQMGKQVGTVGSTGLKDPDAVHLDFRVYQFKDGREGEYNTENAKKFYDPFEFFDFDVQYEYVNLEGYGNQDYH